ncbi:Axin interactor [Durusdinium trenchii]|uniref:Dorsalization-associated protein (Axin interaction partner and dorsalization antagonist) n=2 Tax=Durusdinium trenchii TaxID=1381693 RepID=A0ABP0IST0_9DINO
MQCSGAEGGGVARPAMAMSEKEQLRLSWMTQFNKAQQHDSWGQVVEAQEDYQSMASQIAAKQGLPFITSKEKDILHRLALCLGARAQALRTLHENITVTDMKCLQPIFEALFTGAEPDVFPVDASKYQFAASMVKPSTEGEIICADAEDETSTDWHQRQAVLRTVRGTVVCFRIEKIGLKDAQDYIDPFMTVLVADSRANILDSRDTNFACERRATHVMFTQQVYLNVSLEDMERSGAAIFFEFKHYKPKKKKISTRCWCFMELAELKRDEEVVLEIYHKPTDLKKKKLNLHSEKPLYLHLFATFISN